MNKLKIDEIINFSIPNAVKDYTKFLSSRNATEVLNNIILNYVENLEKITDYTDDDTPDSTVIFYLKAYSVNMKKLWDELRKLHGSDHFEFNIGDPFQGELSKVDEELSVLIFGAEKIDED